MSPRGWGSRGGSRGWGRDRLQGAGGEPPSQIGPWAPSPLHIGPTIPCLPSIPDPWSLPPSPRSQLTCGCQHCPWGASREGETDCPVVASAATALWAGQAATNKLGAWVSCKDGGGRGELWGHGKGRRESQGPGGSIRVSGEAERALGDRERPRMGGERRGVGFGLSFRQHGINGLSREMDPMCGSVADPQFLPL